MSLGQDLKLGVRVLQKSPGLVAVAALSIGLGIGVNTTMFSVLHAALFDRPEVDAPEQLVNVYTRRENSEGFGTNSIADWRDLRERSESLSDLAGYSLALMNVERDGRPSLEVGSIVTPGYFEMLGVDAQHGRRFLSEEQERGAAPVVLLTHRYWERAFAQDPSAIGDSLRIGGADFTIAGVLPQGFNGLLRGIEAELFVPAAQLELVEPAGQIENQGRRPSGASLFDWRGYRFLTLTGRLADGQNSAGVQAELQTLMAALASEHPDSNEKLTATVLPTSKVLVNPSIDGTLLPGAGLLLVMVGLVLLVACANLANLLLARAVARRREIGVRLALGASQRQLLRQLLAESSLLAAVGALSGLAIAFVALRFLATAELDLPISPNFDYELGGPVLFFALGLTALTALICGSIPALQAARTSLVPALKAEAGTGYSRGSRRLPSLGSVLVVLQVAFSLILVIGASLMARSVGAARDVDLGFEAEPVGVLTLDLDALDLDRSEARERFRALADALAAEPEIEAAGLTTRIPLGLNMVNGNFFIPGHRETEDDPPLQLEITYADPGYFDVMGSQLLEGRLFDSRDRAGAPRVAVVTREMARRFWPEEGAVGKRFRMNVADSSEIEIVGVIEDHKVITPGEMTRPFVHLAWDQSAGSYSLLAFRSRTGADGLLEKAAARVQALEPGAFLVDSTTLVRQRDTMLLPVRAGGSVFAAMALLALALSGTGLAGLIAYRVGQRTREIGLHMALGADRGTIARNVLTESLGFVAAGSGLGLLGAFALGKALESVLYVSSWDPVSMVVGVGALIVVAALASWAPARRAARVDPLIALRQT